MSYSNNASASGSGNVERQQPSIQGNAQVCAAEASAINNRLETLLDRLRTPGPRSIDAPRGNDAQSMTPTLQSLLGATSKLQARTHELLTEIESLV